MRILAVDPGEKNLGVALSDPSGTIANPLIVLKHVARPVDAAAIAQLAGENGVSKIVIGAAYDDEGNPTPSSRQAEKLAAELRRQTELPIELWDESGSTQEARFARIAMGASRRKRSGHLDALAAVVILQSYLDYHETSGSHSRLP